MHRSTGCQFSRRALLLATGSAFISCQRPSVAIADDPETNLLEKMRRAGVARVGIANAPPFSALRSDGTLTGIGPTIAQRILERLGIPKMEGVIATYGELIPGLFAGRWDFVAASMSITRERCSQVLYADPLTFEGPCIVEASDATSPPPQTIAELSKNSGDIGALSGGAQYRQLLAGGVQANRILQFANETAMVDALIARRVQFLYVTHLPITEIVRRRRIELKIVFPVADAIAPGASNVFRRQDLVFYNAYQQELRALRASGEWKTLANQFGFEIPDSLANFTSEQLCQAAAATQD